jgi:hypothetical protein
MLATSVSAPPHVAKGASELAFFLALGPFFNAVLVYDSSRHWRMSIWPLGLATMLGVAGGYWLLWWENSRQRPARLFSPGPWVALEAAAYVIGTLLVVAVVLLRPSAVARLPNED